MSEQDERSEQIARLLREQGPVQAPDNLAGEVMSRVRAEPRRRARRAILPGLTLRPVLAYAAAATVLLAVGIGIATQAGGGGYAGSSAAPEAVAGDLGAGALPAARTELRVNLSVATARTLLGSHWRDPVNDKLVVVLPAAQFTALSQTAAKAAKLDSLQGERVIVVLRRAPG